MPTATAKAIFDADDSRMSAAMARIGAKLKGLDSLFSGLGSTISSNFAGLAPAAAAAFLTHKAFSELSDIFAKADQLQHLHDTTGEAVGDLYALESVFKKVGGTAEDALAILGKMQGTLFTGSSNSLLEKLGLDPDHLRRANPVDAFREIGTAISKIGNATDRSGLAMEIFGKKGREALAVFAGGNAGAMFDEARRVGDVYERNAEKFSAIHNKLEGIPAKLNASWLMLADRLADTLLPILDTVDKALSKLNRSGVAGDVMSFLGNSVIPGGNALAGIEAGQKRNIPAVFDNILTPGTAALLNNLFGTTPAAPQKKDAAKDAAAAELFNFNAASESGVTALGRIGGNWGGGAGDPFLDEARNQSRLLEQIAANTAARGTGSDYSAAVVAGATYAR